MFRASTLKVRDKERIKSLIKTYANTEKITDEAKAATLLIYEGYKAWIVGRFSRETDERLAKYFTLSSELIEAMRVMVEGLRDTVLAMDDGDPHKDKLRRYIRYGEKILNKAVIEIGLET